MEKVGQNVFQVVDQGLEKEASPSARSQSERFVPIHSLLCESDFDIDTSKDTAEKGFSCLAKKQIAASPYLLDLEFCLNWTDIYFWKVGDLKNFLKRLSQEKEEFDDAIYLEYKLNKFIKVSKSLTTDDFAEALENLDSYQSMNALLSVIVGSPCVKDAPISLLENYIKTSFLRHCNSQNDIVGDFEEGEEILKFTLKCFVLLPFPILLNIAIKVCKNLFKFIFIVILSYTFS